MHATEIVWLCRESLHFELLTKNKYWALLACRLRDVPNAMEVKKHRRVGKIKIDTSRYCIVGAYHRPVQTYDNFFFYLSAHFCIKIQFYVIVRRVRSIIKTVRFVRWKKAIVIILIKRFQLSG